MSKIGKVAGALTLAAVMGAAAAPAMAQDMVRGKRAGDVVVGLSAIGVLPENRGGYVDTIGGKPRASNSATGQVDFSYFVTPNFALNLIAASTNHDLSAKGTALGKVELGSIWVLPPTLTLQYHFFPQSRFSPYIGGGINYSVFYGYDRDGANALVRKVNVNSSFGFALNAGFDYEISGPLALNFDVKKIFLDPGVSVRLVDGTKLHGRVDLNPWVVGAGVRYRFSL